MNQQTSPFKFLDSYQQDDRDVFFGRNKEILDLYNALSGVKHLLLYGPSGSGKTSLIECGLRNQFSDADWFALTIRRGSDLNASFFIGINDQLNDKIKLNAVTKLPEDSKLNFGQATEALFSERYQPVYLLFDQFEELLILGNDEEKKEFFGRLNQLIHYKVPCRVILIMREEFIGYLSEFEYLCPSLFQLRFRLEKMGRTNVHEVISNILTAPRYLAFFDVDKPGVLCDAILAKLPDVKHEIELAHVQVFLGELWNRALKAVKDNSKPLLHPGLIKDTDNLESVLDIFLKNQFAELEVDYGDKAPLELLASMITERNTKLQAGLNELQSDLDEKGVKLNKPLSNLLKELETRRIIRTIKAGDDTQYEISHDILALLVGQNLTKEMRLRERAQEIYNVYEERTGFYTEDDLNYLQPYELYWAYPPSLKKRIDESKLKIDADKLEHEEAQKRILNEEAQRKGLKRRNRNILIFLIAIGIFAVFAVIELYYVYKQETIATQHQADAEELTNLAIKEKIIATDARKKAEAEEHIAYSNALAALKNDSIAQIAKKKAEKQENLAIIAMNNAKNQMKIAQASLKKSKEDLAEAYKDRDKILSELTGIEQIPTKDLTPQISGEGSTNTPILNTVLRKEYFSLFDSCIINQDKVEYVDHIVEKIAANKARYEAVGNPLQIPWYFIAMLHYRESDLRFDKHLINGDPLTDRTVHIPANRPPYGNPPFTWEESATDALVFEKINQRTDWSLPAILYAFEAFDGFGYRKFHPLIKTPFLWGFSNIYTKGKYAADGKWDPDLISMQAGTAVILKRMVEKGYISFDDK